VSSAERPSIAEEIEEAERRIAAAAARAAAEEAAHRERLGAELQRIGKALSPLEAWRGELRTEAAEGRVAALEAAAEAFSERLHGLEASAHAAAEEARRLREVVDELRTRPGPERPTALAAPRAPTPPTRPSPSPPRAG
jgi:chromosome segregation ATPase